MTNTLTALQARLSTLTGQPEQLLEMPDKGLAHWHTRWLGYGLVARVLSQIMQQAQHLPNLRIPNATRALQLSGPSIWRTLRRGVGTAARSHVAVVADLVRAVARRV